MTTHSLMLLTDSGACLFSTHSQSVTSWAANNQVPWRSSLLHVHITLTIADREICRQKWRPRKASFCLQKNTRQHDLFLTWEILKSLCLLITRSHIRWTFVSRTKNRRRVMCGCGRRVHAHREGIFTAWTRVKDNLNVRDMHSGQPAAAGVTVCEAA